MRNSFPEDRKRLDDLSASVGLDSATPTSDISTIAKDAFLDGRSSDAMAVLATIPPVTLGKTAYRVLSANDNGMTLVGPRGGISHLVPALKQVEFWAHNQGTKTTWYRKTENGFTYAR